MQLILRKMTIQNFKGIKDFTFETNGKSVSVLGDNGVGKSTIGNAATWCLYGQDMEGRTKFEFKPIDSDNNVIHNLKTFVEMSFVLRGEKEVSFGRSVEEVWKRPRGQKEKILSSHSTNFYIDGNERDNFVFNEHLSAIAAEDIFKLLTNPYHFNNNLKWQERREILYSLLPEIQVNEIISGSKELQEVEFFPGLKSMYSSSKKDLDVEVAGFDKAIEEAQRKIVETKTDKAVLLKVIDSSREEIKDLQVRLLQAVEGGNAIELNRQLLEKRAELWGLEVEQQKQHEEQIEASHKAWIEDDTEKRSVVDLESKQKSDIFMIDLKIESFQRELELCGTQWKTLKAELEVEIPDNCPTCGTTIDDTAAQSYRNIATASIRKKLSEVSEKGIDTQKFISRLKGEKEEQQQQLEETLALLSIKTKEAEQTRSNYLAIARKTIETQEMSQIKRQIEEIENKISKGRSHTKTNDIEADILKKTENLTKLESELRAIEKNAEAKADIERLQKEWESVGNKLALVEKQLILCKAFDEVKANLMEERINALFSKCQFRLFKAQVKADPVMVCDTLINGKPFAEASDSERTVAGLNIISVLNKHYKVYLPIFVDRCESVQNMPEMECQLIQLVVPNEILVYLDGDKKEVKREKQQYKTLTVKI